jgi:hypothetical protein
MVTSRHQKEYQNLNLHKTKQYKGNKKIPKRITEPKTTHRQYNGHKKIPKRLSEPKSTHRQYNGHKKIPKRFSVPKSTQDNTIVTRRYQREYQILNLNKTIQWSQEDTKEIIRT